MKVTITYKDLSEERVNNAVECSTYAGHLVLKFGLRTQKLIPFTMLHQVMIMEEMENGYHQDSNTIVDICYLASDGSAAIHFKAQNETVECHRVKIEEGVLIISYYVQLESKWYRGRRMMPYTRYSQILRTEKGEKKNE